MAVGAFGKRHVLRLHNAGDEQYRVLELKLGIRPPFPEGLERLTEELAILKARQPLSRRFAGRQGDRADNAAHRCE